MITSVSLFFHARICLRVMSLYIYRRRAEFLSKRESHIRRYQSRWNSTQCSATRFSSKAKVLLRKKRSMKGYSGLLTILLSSIRTCLLVTNTMPSVKRICYTWNVSSLRGFPETSRHSSIVQGPSSSLKTTYFPPSLDDGFCLLACLTARGCKYFCFHRYSVAVEIEVHF
jgi:hypothetical protein